MSCPYQRARILIDGGMPVAAAAREVGKSEHAVRFNLDINGCKAKTLARTRAMRKRQREYVGVIPRQDRTRERKERQKAPLPGQTCIKGDTPIAPTLSFISLPVFNLPPVEPEPPKTFRLAPKIRVTENEGAERIRRIHQAMIRRGRASAPSSIAEVRL